MTEIKLARGKIEETIKGSLAMAPSECNIPPFRLMLKKYGSSAIFTKEIKYKKNLDFTKDDPFIIAYMTSSKLINDVSKNEFVKAICFEGSLDDFTKIKKATEKPLILSINAGEKIKKAIIKDVSGILLNFMEDDKETEIDKDEIKRVAEETSLPLFLRGRLEKPEDIYSLLRKTEASIAVLGKLAEIRPVIFDQTTNYFEKGYYNKITRKRRDKTVKAFEKAISATNYEEDAEEMKSVFLDDSLEY